MKTETKKVNRTVASGIQLVRFRLGAEWYAVPVWKVREIIMPLETYPVPGLRGPVDGVINLRGEIIPVMRVDMLLGVERAADDEGARKSRIVILDQAGGGFGFVVDEVMEVVRVSAEAVQSPPDLGDRGIRKEAILGIVQLSGELVICIDPGKLVSEADDMETITAGSTSGEEPA
jgi:chemotaxis signal transduction protein